MKLSEYVTQVINDPKYGHDIEWVKGNLHRAHMERIEATHDAEVRASVVAEEPEWERQVALHWLEPDTITDRRANDSALRVVARATQGAAEVVERRVTPWVPVKQEGEDRADPR